MTSVRLVGELDANFAWDGRRLYDAASLAGPAVPYDLRGAAAYVQRDGMGGRRILRDPLGINKLFWARDANGDVVVAARPRKLVDDGYPFAEIHAIPRGSVFDLAPARSKPIRHSIVPEAWRSSTRDRATDVPSVAREIRSKLEGYISAVATTHPGARVFVCLSGGLDSSGIAALACRYFPQLVAVSFDLRRPGRQESEDRRTAALLARDLGLPLLEATVSEDELLEKMDTALAEGVDWRDFNVHAALVNAALAATIADELPARAETSPAIVLTGDLANEFMADYHPERYKDAAYYSLPRLPVGALRANLVRGLDTCHREVGVFAAWKLSVVSPYAVAADAYMALGDDFLAIEDRKQQLCQAVFGTLIPDYVYSRPKVRAQAGSAELGGGVLAACVDRGFDAAWLRRRFSKLHDVADARDLDRFIRAGRYRTAPPFPAGE
jgi:asparagine synthetase B (glutamine-hydrolysing)